MLRLCFNIFAAHIPIMAKKKTISESSHPKKNKKEVSVGVVGGLTNLHPLVKFSLALLGKPSAQELMSILAVSGLAQNFGALRSLVTTGIQKGHMKMHLLNILNQLGATEEEKQHFVTYFKDKTVSHHEVINEFNRLRGN